MPVEDASAVDWPLMMKGWEYAQHFLQVAEAEGRTPTWVEIMWHLLLALPLMRQNNELDLSAYRPHQPLQLKHYTPPPDVTKGEQPEDPEDEA